ncbi:MAG: thiamine phosphate synthase [Longimicrobiales bacterium]
MTSSTRPDVPRLHVITNDEIAARPDFISHATSIMEACAGAVAFHLRLKRARAHTLYDLAETLTGVARRTNTALYLNERIDVAVAAGATGVQLTASSIPVSAATSWRYSGVALVIGYSAHGVAEAMSAESDGADFVILGTIWSSGTHPGECTAGIDLITAASERLSIPVVAIGGVTPSRAQEALLAGAHGVAAIAGIWDAEVPAKAATNYLNAMQDVR